MRQRALLQDHQQLSPVGVVETWDQSPKSEKILKRCMCHGKILKIIEVQPHGV